jgi:4-carboxymuconolactone decarboxylase
LQFCIWSNIATGRARRDGKNGDNKNGKQNEGAIFPKGDKAPADHFTGTVYVQMLAQKTESNDYSIAGVTFEPGARSNWHTHPAGQTLLVINGKGLYQEKGKPIKTVNKGDTVICEPDIEHWHCASSESQMTHIAITNDKGNGGVVWLKPVTDDEYKAGGK